MYVFPLLLAARVSNRSESYCQPQGFLKGQKDGKFFVFEFDCTLEFFDCSLKLVGTEFSPRLYVELVGNVPKNVDAKYRISALKTQI